MVGGDDDDDGIITWGPPPEPEDPATLVDENGIVLKYHKVSWDEDEPHIPGEYPGITIGQVPGRKFIDADDPATWDVLDGTWIFQKELRADLEERHRRRQEGRRQPGERDPSARGGRGSFRRTADKIDLGIWNDGVDDEPIPPRKWLLSVWFCRGFVSMLLGDGATGKTAVRVACALALATGRGAIVGEKVFSRCRVLYLSFEDGRDELRRRVKACKIHHKIISLETDGWLFLGAISRSDLKLASQARSGAYIPGRLSEIIGQEIERLGIDVVIFDPFVKTHAVNENDNNALDAVISLLAELGQKYDIAPDTLHHTRKGPGEPGNADTGRGASAAKDGGRLVYTLTKMNKETAELYGIADEARSFFVRVDSAKVNIAPPSKGTKWFRLVDVELGNATQEYPGGDHVQTVEVWHPPDLWKGLSKEMLRGVLKEIDAGPGDGAQYSNRGRATGRAAWKAVQKIIPQLIEAQCREVINEWLNNSVLLETKYDDPTKSRTLWGLKVQSWLD